jgi:ELWxxDGT repeat protein
MIAKRASFIFVLFLLFFARNIYSIDINIVKDLNTSAPSNSSWPTNLKSIGSVVFFAADDGIHGGEPWISNGTNEGTFLLKDISPGTISSSAGLFTHLGPYVYFISQSYPSNKSAAQLWRTDGTRDGTQMIMDGFTAVFNMVRFHEDLFFLVMDESRVTRLWKSNGTSQGTAPFGGPSIEGSMLFPAGNFLYFTGYQETTGPELWRTDGTSQGTILLADIRKGRDSSYPSIVRSFDNLIFFIANDGTHGSELWKSDGTVQGTRLIKDIASGSTSGVFNSSSPFSLRLGSFFYFPANDGIHGTELWKTNGNPEGTAMVSDIRPGGGSSSPVIKAVFKNYLYFAVTDSAHGQELWRTQGTAQSTALFKEIVPGSRGTSFGDFQVTDRLYFEASSSLWTSDGTNDGTKRIPKVVHTEYCSPTCFYFPLYRLGDSVIFASTGSSYLDVELWISSGTSATTHRIKDIRAGNAGSFPKPLAEIGGNLIFEVSPSESVHQLMRTDGTAGGTAPIMFGNAENATVIDGTLWFSSQADGQWSVYKMDQSYEPILLHIFNDYNTPGNFTKFKGEIYFSIINELWKTDGTLSGTVKIIELESGNDWFAISKLLVVDDKLFMLAGSNGNALWISDGSAPGTKLLRYFPVKVITKIPADPIIAIGSKVYFVGSSSNGTEQLWKSDGTKAGTVLVKTIGASWPTASIEKFVSLNNIIYFSAYTKDSTLWRSDGTAEGTFGIASPGDPPEIFVWNNSLYLNAYVNAPAGESHYSLFRSDGTASGTIELQKISAGPFTSNGNRLIFAGRDEEHGNELWMTDGTPQGTTLLKDIWPGYYSSEPNYLITTSTGIYFSADDGVHGDELFRLTP